MHTNLEHLSAEEILKIKTRYYQGDSVYQLLREYNLSIAPSQLYRFFPPNQIEKYGCSKCLVNLVIDAAPRSSQKLLGKPKQFYCPVCKRKPFLENQGWISFPLLSDEEVTKRQNQIKRYYDHRYKPVVYDSLPLTLKIYLAVLCLARLDRSQRIIQPIFGSQILLASTQCLQETIYSKLTKNGVITVNPESTLDAFDLDAKSFPHKYDKEKVSYNLNISLCNSSGNLLSILKKPEILCAEDEEEVLNLWREIAIGECITYLQYRLDKIGFPFSPGEKTQLVFRQLLENFSVSQIYYIIWCKVNDASRWYLEGNVSKQHAANSVIGACLNYGENAVFYERELPQYRRPMDCPQSMLTRFFYYEILKLGLQAENICISDYERECDKNVSTDKSQKE